MKRESKILFIIPARGGSKGIPHKNIKLLAGKPFIYYSIDIARQLTSDKNICVSTDDEEIIETVKAYGLNVPFKRPDELATDTATTNDVLLHAIDYYESKGCFYDIIVLLQPTSPLRKTYQVNDAIKLYNNTLDMVVSVKESKVSTILCEEDNNGFLQLIFNKNVSRRQDAQTLYEYNGAIYVINVQRLKKLGIANFTKRKKYVMDEITSLDIDTPLDWEIAETIFHTHEERPCTVEKLPGMDP